MGAMTPDERYELWKEDPTPDTLYDLWLSVELLVMHYARRKIRIDSAYNQETRLYDFDDLMQAGFLAVYKAALGYKKEQGFKFSTTLRYHIFHHFREASGKKGKKKRPEVYARSLDEELLDGDFILLDILSDPDAEYADAVIENESLMQDFKAMLIEINKLPEDKRKALMLTAYEGLSVKDAATLMNVRTGKVSQLRYKACCSLQSTKTYRRLKDEYSPRHVSYREYMRTGLSQPEKEVLYNGFS
jgi:RNA polymerase sigma factor (sigma-70 family)